MRSYTGFVVRQSWCSVCSKCMHESEALYFLTSYADSSLWRQFFTFKVFMLKKESFFVIHRNEKQYNAFPDLMHVYIYSHQYQLKAPLHFFRSAKNQQLKCKENILNFETSLLLLFSVLGCLIWFTFYIRRLTRIPPFT